MVLKNVLVIPSNRADCLETFCQLWRDAKDWDELIVVWDGPESDAPSVPEAACVLSWDSIERALPTSQLRLLPGRIECISYSLCCHNEMDYWKEKQTCRRRINPSA